MAYDSEQENKLRKYFLGELTFEEQVFNGAAAFSRQRLC